MKQRIRKGVFETNSSSVHSVCIDGTERYAKYDSGVIRAEFGEYGWGYETLKNPSEKLSYVLTTIQYKDQSVNDENIDTLKESVYYKWLSEMVRDYCGCEIELDPNKHSYSWKMGYVDHQSIGNLDGDFWVEDEQDFKANMRELIFNDKYYIEIDNDNH